MMNINKSCMKRVVEVVIPLLNIGGGLPGYMPWSAPVRYAYNKKSPAKSHSPERSMHVSSVAPRVQPRLKI